MFDNSSDRTRQFFFTNKMFIIIIKFGKKSFFPKQLQIYFWRCNNKSEI
jgi:hypothetical protein